MFLIAFTLILSTASESTHLTLNSPFNPFTYSVCSHGDNVWAANSSVSHFPLLRCESQVLLFKDNFNKKNEESQQTPGGHYL